MFLAKKWPFFQIFILGNIGKENVFYNIRERKNGFLKIKRRIWKSGKIEFSPKGLVHAFGQKLAIFQKFYFREYRPGKCGLRCWITKKCLSEV